MNYSSLVATALSITHIRITASLPMLGPTQPLWVIRSSSHNVDSLRCAHKLFMENVGKFNRKSSKFYIDSHQYV